MARNNKLIQFYLTNLCNSKCKTCNIWKNKVKEEIPVEKVIEIIEQFPDADYVFGGGEFTLYSDKHRLLKYCDENKINYTILTNAVNLQLVEEVLDIHRVKNLTISCDGLKHNEIRGKDRNLENIEFIKTHYGMSIHNFKLSYTLSKFNENHIDEDMHYFRKLGFSKIYFCIAQSMDLLKQDSNVTPSYESIKYIYESYPYMLYDKDLQFLKDIVEGRHIKCNSTGNVHTIYTNGDVVACQSYLSYYVIGNIYKNNFNEIVNSFKGIERCKYNDRCQLVCQRRYDYEDRI